MSATSLAVLLAAGIATAVGVAALHTTRGLRRQIAALRADVAVATAAGAAGVPAARQSPAEEIRAAVADALAEERERELAEARAFWAAQEARDAAPGAEGSALLGGLAGFGDEPGLDAAPFVPRQPDLAGLEPMIESELLDAALEAALDPALDAVLDPALDLPGEVEGPDSAELAAARRRHPSHPAHAAGEAAQHAVVGHERTVAALDELAADRTPLVDVRPGPLGTLDVYVFGNGTTVCMTPGHRETADQLAEALRAGDAPVLLGGSGVSGAYTLTFGYGDTSVYVLADRVIASL